MNNAPTAPMPRSFGLSALLHLSIVAVLLVAAWWAQRTPDEQPVVFELVAGAGDNYAATEAPTTTEPVTTIALKLPEPIPEPVRRPEPKPLPPEPKPLPPEPKPQPKPPEPKPQPKPVEKKPEPITIKPVPEKPPVKVEAVPEKVSFADFAKEHGKPAPSPVKQPAPIRPQTINVGKVTSAVESKVTVGAGGTAMTTTEIKLSQAYVALIIQRIRQALEAAGINDVREAGVEFRVSLDGAISNARITQSSGSSKFDQAVLAAFQSIRPIGRPPTGKAEIFTTTIRLREG